MEWLFWRVDQQLLQVAMSLIIPTNQRTLRREVIITGNGLRTNEKCTIRLLPAKPNMGVVFVSGRGIIGADLFSLGDNFSTTCLKSNGFYLEGVEHLLSCLYGLYIDNVEVEVYGPELPQGDGSAWAYARAIQDVGLVDQASKRIFFKITEPVFLQEPERSISIIPSDAFTIHYTMGLPYPEAAHGSISFTLEGNSYMDICKARTWAEKSHIDRLFKMGRLGAKNDNWIVINNGSIHQELRYEDETMRHKVLDCIGDLSLLYGMYILGEVRAHNAGHKMHHELLKGILGDSSKCSSRTV